MNVGNPAISRLHTPLSLTRNFSWTLAGNVVYTGCQWAMLTVLAKLGTPGMVGQFVLSLAVTAPVIMFTNLQLRAVQATDARHEYQFADYLGLRLVCTLLAVAAIIAVTFLSGYRGETATVILAVGAAKAFESISDIYYGLLQNRERMDYIARSMMIKGPLSLIALAMGSYMTGRIFWGACAMALVWGLVLVLYDIPVAGIVLSGKNASDGETGRRLLDFCRHEPAMEQVCARQPHAVFPASWAGYDVDLAEREHPQIFYRALPGNGAAWHLCGHGLLHARRKHHCRRTWTIGLPRIGAPLCRRANQSISRPAHKTRWGSAPCLAEAASLCQCLQAGKSLPSFTRHSLRNERTFSCG